MFFDGEGRGEAQSSKFKFEEGLESCFVNLGEKSRKPNHLVLAPGYFPVSLRHIPSARPTDSRWVTGLQIPLAVL